MDFDDDGRHDNNKYIDWKVLSTNNIIILQLQSHFKHFYFYSSYSSIFQVIIIFHSSAKDKHDEDDDNN